MTSYNGQAITYDEIGNPASIGNRSFTWQNGRQLASQTYNGSTWTYSYNNAGLRTSRSNGSVTYHYIYNGDKLTQMTIADEVNHTQQVMDFTYDANGQLLTMTYGGEVYYYILSLQGDVAGITDSQGNRLIDFHYEGYGAGYYTSYDTEKAALLAQINPFGYRSYVMDLGTGMYYLQSRYYDPTLGRFINADAYVATGQGFIGNNMFAYCLNNPVNFVDYGGNSPDTLLATWAGGMWWLCGADAFLPIGDAIYVIGVIILGVISIGSIIVSSQRSNGPVIIYDEADESDISPQPPNNQDPDDDDDYDDDDYDDEYYNNDKNFGGREKIGKPKGNTPGNNQAQNKQFNDATKGLDKDKKSRLHGEFSKSGSGFHDIFDAAKNFWFWLVGIFDSDEE